MSTKSFSPPPNDEGDTFDDSFDGGDIVPQDKKRKHDDFQSPSETEISNDVMVKTPHFITKTFQMISDSPRDIVEWTEPGDKFIVKDPERLASECIPRYFNHNNFSSFTRQLNFYRFRKMFPSAFARQGDNAINEKHLIFFHDKFNRDHPEWLPDIKRSTKTTKSSAEQEALIEELQTQVGTLEKRVTILSSELHLKVSTLAQEFERKLLDVRNSMLQESNTGGSYHTTQYHQPRSFAAPSTRSSYPPPPPPPGLSSQSHIPPPGRLNRYTTEDFIRSLVTGVGVSGSGNGSMLDNDRDRDRNSSRLMPAPPPRASAIKAPLTSLTADDADTEAVPPPPRPINRLGTLTLDDINRIVTHLEGDGRTTDNKREETSNIPGPPSLAGQINSLSAEEVLMTIRQMDNARHSKVRR